MVDFIAVVDGTTPVCQFTYLLELCLSLPVIYSYVCSMILSVIFSCCRVGLWQHKAGDFGQISVHRIIDESNLKESVSWT